MKVKTAAIPEISNIFLLKKEVKMNCFLVLPALREEQEQDS